MTYTQVKAWMLKLESHLQCLHHRASQSHGYPPWASRPSSPSPLLTDLPRRITAEPRPVAHQGLSTHNSGGNYELSGGRVSPSRFLRDRQEGERIEAEQWITKAGHPVLPFECVWASTVIWGSICLIHSGCQNLPGSQKKCGSAHPGLASLAAGSDVPASALDLDLVLKRLFCSSSKDTSPLKA